MEEKSVLIGCGIGATDVSGGNGHPKRRPAEAWHQRQNRRRRSHHFAAAVKVPRYCVWQTPPAR